MNVPEDNGWLLKDSWTTRELTITAKTVVPKRLAKQFAIAVDSETCVVQEGAIMPKAWPYSMRCVEFYPDALEWVRQQCQHLSGSDRYATAFTNAVKVIAMAADIQTEKLLSF